VRHRATDRRDGRRQAQHWLRTERPDYDVSTGMTTDTVATI
jgi:hypothetical protein